MLSYTFAFYKNKKAPRVKGTENTLLLNDSHRRTTETRSGSSTASLLHEYVLRICKDPEQIQGSLPTRERTVTVVGETMSTTRAIKNQTFFIRFYFLYTFLLEKCYCKGLWYINIVKYKMCEIRNLCKLHFFHVFNVYSLFKSGTDLYMIFFNTTIVLMKLIFAKSLFYNL